ncbi:MAG TPA: hypothetical protein VGF14_07220 [Alphaproteobacteria bacterium]
MSESMTISEKPVSLIMLLSMAKLEKGDAETQKEIRKRWQDPDNMILQTQEAISKIQASGRTVDQLVLLYTDTLYFNSDKPADGLHDKYQKILFEHIRNTKKKFEETEFTPSILLWNDLLMTQNNLSPPRHALINLYKNNPAFREAVQSDNPKRQDIAAYDINPTPSDMFVMEEAGLFLGLAKGYVVHDKIKAGNDIVMSYPGPSLASLDFLQDKTKSPRIHKGRPTQTVNFSWLNVESAQEAIETVPREQFTIGDLARKAASYVLPFLVGASMITDKPEKPSEDYVTMAKNEYRMSLQLHRTNGQTIAVDYNNHDKYGWTASTISFSEDSLSRPLVFREDLANVQAVERAAEQANLPVPCL